MIFVRSSYQTILFTEDIRDLAVTGLLLLASSEALDRLKTGKKKYKHYENDDEEDNKKEDAILVHWLHSQVKLVQVLVWLLSFQLFLPVLAPSQGDPVSEAHVVVWEAVEPGHLAADWSDVLEVHHSNLWLPPVSALLVACTLSPSIPSPRCVSTDKSGISSQTFQGRPGWQ